MAGWEGDTCSVQGSDERKSVTRISVANPEWTRPPVMLRHRWKTNVNVNITDALHVDMGSG